MTSSSASSSHGTRYGGRVTTRMFEKAVRGPSLTISLDEPYDDCIDVTTSRAEVARDAIERGIEFSSRVYVIFKSDEAGKFEVATVELDTSDRTRHPGVVKTRMFETPERPASLTIKLDKPYHDCANVVARAAVTKAALQRGVELNLPVYVVFNTSKDRFMEVDAVERRYE